MEFRVKEICKEKGITMETLAGMIGVNRVNLTASLKGNPTIGTLEKIARALGVEVTELFHPTTDFIALVRDNGETMTFQKKEELKKYVDGWNLPE